MVLFLAALSSSRSLIVCRSALGVCEKITWPTYLPTYTSESSVSSDISNSSDSRDSSDSSDRSDNNCRSDNSDRSERKKLWLGRRQILSKTIEMNKKNYEKVKLGRTKLNGKICVDTKKKK